MDKKVYKKYIDTEITNQKLKNAIKLEGIPKLFDEQYNKELIKSGIDDTEQWIYDSYVGNLTSYILDEDNSEQLIEQINKFYNFIEKVQAQEKNIHLEREDENPEWIYYPDTDAFEKHNKLPDLTEIEHTSKQIKGFKDLNNEFIDLKQKLDSIIGKQLVIIEKKINDISEIGNIVSYEIREDDNILLHTEPKSSLVLVFKIDQINQMILGKNVDNAFYKNGKYVYSIDSSNEAENIQSIMSDIEHEQNALDALSQLDGIQKAEYQKIKKHLAFDLIDQYIHMDTKTMTDSIEGVLLTFDEYFFECYAWDDVLAKWIQISKR